MKEGGVTYVHKACAYVTRDGRDLLVFEGPEHDDLQIPKGTIEYGETPREGLVREVTEETGIESLGSVRHLVTDVWTRRRSPRRHYVRHFFHATVEESRDEWTHVVTGDGDERGLEFECSWVAAPREYEFALDLDAHLSALFDGPAHQS